MKYIVKFLLCINLVFVSCNEQKQTVIPPVKEQKIAQKIILHKTDKFIITDFASEVGYGDTTWVNSKYNPAYETTDTSVIKKFEQLLKDKKKKKYCCCPSRSFILSFFDNNKNYKSYVIEILKEKDSILVYDYSYQFSSKISKNQWNDLLKKSKKLIAYHSFSCDLNNSRMVFKYAKENKLTIAYNYKDSREWPYYDGDFKFTVSKFGKKLTENEIKDNIRKAYPNIEYKVELSNYYELCGSYDPNVDDCKTKYTVTISCSKDFYNKFNLYQPKSIYSKFCPNFLILGVTNTTGKELKRLNKNIEQFNGKN